MAFYNTGKPGVTKWLDNLKLGYGGTQAEMKRLIKEAAAMKDTQAELGVTVMPPCSTFAPTFAAATASRS